VLVAVFELDIVVVIHFLRERLHYQNSSPHEEKNMANQKGCIDFLANEKSFYEIHTENSCYVQEMKQVLQKIEEFGKMVLSHAWRDANTQERIAAVVVDALFCLIAIVYSSNVLAPLPMTYLSEILFPWDVSEYFCLTIL
jgi:hypothetical protein